jgi:IS5 family transposase
MSKNDEVFSMNNLVDFALKEKYASVKMLRSRLEDMNKLINWNEFHSLFPDKKAITGRPSYDKTIMVKILVLQSWYGISDEEIEFQIRDRFSFQQFLGFPKTIPDYSTIWRFRDELTEDDIIDKIWTELNRQIGNKNIKVNGGKIQDATFVHADPGKTNSGMNGRGREAKTSRSKDGSWTKKGNKSIFGFKSHVKIDVESKLIEEVAISSARVYDGNVDLANPDDIMYRDRGYSGSKTKAKGDGTMKRGKLSPKEILRNKRISIIRSRGEHPFGTIHRSFNAGRTKLTTIPRVFVQQVFVCMAYNIHRVLFLLKRPSGSYN